MQGRVPPDCQSTVLHATTVEFCGMGVLITGASGTGKSALALQLMALGARLVSDDRTRVVLSAGKCTAQAPDTISGLIEARGVGILRAESAPDAHLVLAIDMDRIELDRLPERHEFCHGFVRLPCLHKVDAPYFPAAIVQYLKGSKQETR